jgi:hypothetical protein
MKEHACISAAAHSIAIAATTAATYRAAIAKAGLTTGMKHDRNTQE